MLAPGNRLSSGRTTGLMVQAFSHWRRRSFRLLQQGVGGRWYVMHYRVMHGYATSLEHIRFRSSTSSCWCGSKFGDFCPCREHLMCFGGGSHRMEPTLRPRLMEPCSLVLRGLLGQGRFGRPRRRQESVPSSGWYCTRDAGPQNSGFAMACKTVPSASLVTK